jgi:hypothetical protein
MTDTEQLRKKFGAIMMGYSSKGELLCVAPWTEGKGPSGELSFNLAKGNPQEGLSPEENMEAEFQEETSIYLHPLRASGGIIHEERLEPVIYEGQSGELTALESKLVVVNNIMALQGHKLIPQNSLKTAQQLAAEDKQLPELSDMLHCLYTGELRGQDRCLIANQVGKQTIKQYIKKPIHTEQEWNTLLNMPEIKAALIDDMHAIRRCLEEQGKLSDKKGVKLDHKGSRPLRYFQEGASILPVEEYIDAIKTHANKPGREVYKKVMLGDKVGEGQLQAVEQAVEQSGRASRII